MNQQEQLTYLCDQVREIGARARRTETNIHKVREHLGIPTANHAEADDQGNVTVHGHDVTLSQIKRALEDRGMFEVSDPFEVSTMDGRIAVVIFLK